MANTVAVTTSADTEWARVEQPLLMAKALGTILGNQDAVCSLNALMRVQKTHS